MICIKLFKDAATCIIILCIAVCHQLVVKVRAAACTQTIIFFPPFLNQKIRVGAAARTLGLAGPLSLFDDIGCMPVGIASVLNQFCIGKLQTKNVFVDSP